MPELKARIPARLESTLAIELLQFGLHSESEVVHRGEKDIIVKIQGPLGKAGEAVTRAGGVITGHSLVSRR